jgi:hypothetical protein
MFSATVMTGVSAFAGACVATSSGADVVAVATGVAVVATAFVPAVVLVTSLTLVATEADLAELEIVIVAFDIACLAAGFVFIAGVEAVCSEMFASEGFELFSETVC